MSDASFNKCLIPISVKTWRNFRVDFSTMTVILRNTRKYANVNITRAEKVFDAGNVLADVFNWIKFSEAARVPSYMLANVQVNVSTS